jgi:hypothetical protein
MLFCNRIFARLSIYAGGNSIAGVPLYCDDLFLIAAKKAANKKPKTIKQTAKSQKGSPIIDTTRCLKKLYLFCTTIL